MRTACRPEIAASFLVTLEFIILQEKPTQARFSAYAVFIDPDSRSS